jgi:hypothetical protein
MTPTEEENWRKEFKRLGPDGLRLRLEFRRPEFTDQYARAAEAWILEQDAKKAVLETSRYRWILGWTIVAAIAAGVAAVPAVRDFFK